MKYAACTLLLSAVAALGGCTRAMELPRDFVKVEDGAPGSSAVRGISADGVMVALRSEKGPAGGSLGFWMEAITHQMVGGLGYKPAGSEAVQSTTGVPGRVMTFTTEKQGVAFTYLVAVFVQGGDILIAEAGGCTDAVEPKSVEIRHALLTAR